ncbi:MAG: glycosyltransferase family 39 protein [bacterium]|nr:glycosyltransferase family 39 protein [bacterium]
MTFSTGVIAVKNFIKIPAHRRLLYVLASIFIVTIAYAFYFQIEPAVDARAYDNIAKNIVQHGVYKERLDASYAKDMSIQRAGPGYEYFLAGIYRIFGYHYEMVWFLQALLHTFTAWLIYLITSKVFDLKNDDLPAVIATIIFGLHPDLIEISAMLMTETLFLFLITLVVYSFVKTFHRTESWLNACCLGFALAVGILVRPTILLFAPIILALYFIRHRGAQAAIFMAIIVLALIPWTVRNYQIYHQFIPTTVISEYNLWVGNTLLADGGQLADGLNPFDEYVENYDFFSVGAAAKQAFIDFLIQHPGSFVGLTLIRFIRYFSLLRPMGFWFYQTGPSQLIFIAASAFSIAVLFIAGIAGMIKLWAGKDSLCRYLVCLAVTAPLPLLITVVQSRYRFPIYPFLAIFAGYFIVYAVRHAKWWREKYFLAPTVVLLFVSLADLSANVEKILDRLRIFF